MSDSTQTVIVSTADRLKKIAGKLTLMICGAALVVIGFKFTDAYKEYKTYKNNHEQYMSYKKDAESTELLCSAVVAGFLGESQMSDLWYRGAAIAIIQGCPGEKDAPHDYRDVAEFQICNGGSVTKIKTVRAECRDIDPFKDER